MKKEIKIVIGANFGDEGKGLITDYFCHQLLVAGHDVLNIRHNGGAQAAHNVVTPDGKQHVFSHFGAGSKEIDYQIKAAKAKLEASGIVTENLDIH